MAIRRWISTIDSHTAGHPTRVVTGGVPPLRGDTVEARAEDFRARFDPLRTFLLHEPRGHAAMVGVVMTESTRADFGAFFLGSYKYLEMCGHATIGLAVTLDHMGLIGASEEPTSSFTLEVPAGVITVHVQRRDGAVATVTFENVPAHVAASGVTLNAGGVNVSVDVAWGGNWYGLVEAHAAEVVLAPAGVSHAMATGAALKAALNAKITEGGIAGVARPIDSILFYETQADGQGVVSRQLVVLESNKFDRSPCGTGSSARLAQMVARGEIELKQPIRTRNILDVDFTATARAIEGRTDAIEPHIVGLAHITGEHRFVLAQGDPLPDGFLCR
ncbi:proline racemase family protein [Ancylobacter pratisalsi]|uniref:4-hydroxyproline epimerase n=1 Tax=Ancylobacter pratisalsi TaxID=1745854 RepID=A0A6P1YSD7_9HYPH|nr:proline racemase family protein [Ancylobacter pratisalsi]QIB35945.1 proline racemase family protein [Ancylobacter pratisalsi]